MFFLSFLKFFELSWFRTPFQSTKLPNLNSVDNFTALDTPWGCQSSGVKLKLANPVTVRVQIKRLTISEFKKNNLPWEILCVCTSDGGSNNKATSGNSGHLTLSYSCCRIKYPLVGQKCKIHRFRKVATVKVEIILEQRQVVFLSPSKICENLNFSREIQIFANFAG